MVFEKRNLASLFSYMIGESYGDFLPVINSPCSRPPYAQVRRFGRRSSPFFSSVIIFENFYFAEKKNMLSYI